MTGKATPPEVTIVVPTYNEAENVPVLVQRIDRALRSAGIIYEIVIVDDNSPDGTADIARKLARDYPIKVIVRPGKLGLASAVIEGMRHAEGKYIVVMDADLQHPPEKIPELIEKLREGYDLVIASRYVKGGADLGLTPYRKLVSLGARILAWLLLPQTRRVKDIMSGFFALRRELAIERTRLRGYKILLEILVSRKNIKVCEVPFTFQPRYRGKSKLGVREYVNYIIDLLKLSNYFTVKYVIVAGILALVSKLLTPLVGIFTLAVSILARWVILRRDVGLSSILVAELSSTGLKWILKTSLEVALTYAWILGAILELLLVHLLRHLP